MPILQNNTVFYDLLDELSAHAVSCADRLRRLVGGAGDRAREIGLIRSEEADADRLVHRLLGHLSGAFLAPFDPQDVHVLAGELDTVIDDIDALSQRLETYRLASTEPRFLMQTELLVRLAASVFKAVRKLRFGHRLSGLRASLAEVYRLASVGRANHRAAVARLFESGAPPLYVLRWKDVYARAESAIADCDRVANTLERIALKY